MKVELPCKVGDTVWGISNTYDKKHIYSGVVSEIYFPTEDMTPVIKVRKVCTGHWGEKVFATQEEAIEKLKGGKK